MTAVDHGARSHATWSASASARNWACPGALRLIANMDVPDKESEASAWGTAAHQIAEKCLREGKDAADFIGTVETTKERTVEVDDELAETAQVYVDYVRGSATGCQLMIEQQFNLERIAPPFDAGGTGDAVIYDAVDRSLEIVDLKGGRGVVVEAHGNKQLRTYALGAMLANATLAVERITVTIVQPRAPHKDGRIRSETFHVADLMEWTSELLAAMGLSKEAWDAWVEIGQPITGGVYTLAMWAAAYLNPGPHCASTFCKTMATCPALQKAALDAAGVWFDASDTPHLSNTPDKLMPEDIAKYLDTADMIDGWLSALRAYGHQQAEMGVVIPGYVLVNTVGREVWAKGAEETVQKAAAAAGLAEDKFLNPPKLRTPKQVREAAKKAGVAKADSFLTEHSTTPTTGTALVRKEHTSKPPATPKVAQFFDILT